MKIEKLSIGKNHAVLTGYIQRNAPEVKIASRRPAVLILPGGGYEFVSNPENEPVSLEYSAKGFQAFTLEYSVKEKGVFPVPEIEVMLALAEIRAHAEEWFVDKDKIVLVGFSAGGHLAASVGVHWNRPELLEAAGIKDAEEAKPNAMVLVYPCITAGEYSYPGIASVHGKGLSEEKLKLLSVQNYVGPHTPPTYLCHTAEDTCVPVMNTLLFAEALARNKIPFETRIFKDGHHGMSLATVAVRPDVEKLPEDVRELLKEPKVQTHIRKAMAAFSVWMQESLNFLFNIFNM